MKRSRFTFCLGLAIFAVPLSARGEDFERAKTLFGAGAQAYDAGQYPVAIQAFQEAYKAAQRPPILFSLAQAERKQWVIGSSPSDLRSASAHYRQYLDQVQNGGRRNDATSALAELQPALARLDATSAPPPVPMGSGSSSVAVPPPPPVPTAAPEPQKTRLFITSSTPGAIVSVDGAKGTGPTFTVEDAKVGTHKVHVAADGFMDVDRDAIVTAGGGFFTQDVELTEKPGVLALACDDGADVSIDGRLVATTPLGTPLQLPAGPHYLVVTKNGHRAFSREVTLSRGQTLDVPVALDRSGQRVASFVLLGAGGAGVVAGGVFAGLSFAAQSRAQKVLDAKSQGNITSAQIDSYNSSVDARDQWKTMAVAFAGAGLAVAATGLIFYAFDKPSIPPSGLLPDAAPKPKPTKAPDSMDLAATPLLGPGLYGLAVGGRM